MIRQQRSSSFRGRRAEPGHLVKNGPCGLRELSKKSYTLFARAGGNFIDTANIYTNGSSEVRVLGESLGGYRIASCFAINTHSAAGKDPNAPGPSKSNMRPSKHLKRPPAQLHRSVLVHIWDQVPPCRIVIARAR